MGDWSDLKILLRKSHMTAWLEFAKQHLRDSEGKRFSGLMRQEQNTLAWMPIAVSSKSQILLITWLLPFLWGCMMPTLSFRDASAQQALGNRSELSEKSHTFLVCLSLCPHLFKVVLLSTAFYNCIKNVISVFSLQKAVLRYPKGLDSSFLIRWRIHLDHLWRNCLLRETKLFSLQKQQGRSDIFRVHTDVTYSTGRIRMRRQTRGLVGRQGLQ